MDLIENYQDFMTFLRYNKCRSVKIVSIIDRYYAVSLTDLVKSKDYKDLEVLPLEITQELIDSFPRQRHQTKYVTEKLLNRLPIVMFETPEYDGVYWRFDGRHRIIGANNLGLSEVPAKYVPRDLWAKYIVCQRSKDDPDEVEPISWYAPPYTSHLPSRFHYEPMFLCPEPDIELPIEEVYKDNDDTDQTPEGWTIPEWSNASFGLW